MGFQTKKRKSYGKLTRDTFEARPVDRRAPLAEEGIKEDACASSWGGLENVVPGWKLDVEGCVANPCRLEFCCVTAVKPIPSRLTRRDEGCNVCWRNRTLPRVLENNLKVRDR